MERLPREGPQGPTLQCGHCSYRWYYSKCCEANELECLLQTPGCPILCDCPSARTSGILKLTHLFKKLNTRWSAKIRGNFPPWIVLAKTNQTTWLCFPPLLLACKQHKHRSLCWRYGVTPNQDKRSKQALFQDPLFCGQRVHEGVLLASTWRANQIPLSPQQPCYSNHDSNKDLQADVISAMASLLFQP